MIEPVSNINTPKNTGMQKEKNTPQRQERSFVMRYADSFIKHSIDSAPTLTGLTLVWSFLDKSRGIPLKKAFSNNIKNFFLPVILVTSAVTAFIENKNLNQKGN